MGCLQSKEAGKKETKDLETTNESETLVSDPNALTQGRVEDFYDIRKELGRGTFSIVKEGVNKKTAERVAVKFIDKKYVDKEDLLLLSREIEIMKRVKHENILALREIFETTNQLSLVMELVNGGELFFKIVEKGNYSEKDAAAIVSQIVDGVKYLHSLGIAHRDLKPENLLCSEETGAPKPKKEESDDEASGDGGTKRAEDSMNMKIKIADFGLSKIFAGGQQLETSCGTPDYAAPEVLIGEEAYDCSVDLWSVGVITYVLLCGYPPFYAQTQPALFEKIIKAKYDFPASEWDLISATAKDFVKRLLVIEPTKRMTADECLQHPFLTRNTNTVLLRTETLTQYNIKRRKAMQKVRDQVKEESESE